MLPASAFMGDVGEKKRISWSIRARNSLSFICGPWVICLLSGLHRHTDGLPLLPPHRAGHLWKRTIYFLSDVLSKPHVLPKTVFFFKVKPTIMVTWEKGKKIKIREGDGSGKDCYWDTLLKETHKMYLLALMFHTGRASGHEQGRWLLPLFVFIYIYIYIGI